ncbi:MAG: hypothetical protein M1817_002504 [Caeruleum heppii]|nr:MAG: hypothetical protein M1817_002504 [Caeruleum heppii]
MSSVSPTLPPHHAGLEETPLDENYAPMSPDAQEFLQLSSRLPSPFHSTTHSSPHQHDHLCHHQTAHASLTPDTHHHLSPSSSHSNHHHHHRHHHHLDDQLPGNFSGAANSLGDRPIEKYSIHHLHHQHHPSASSCATTLTPSPSRGSDQLTSIPSSVGDPSSDYSEQTLLNLDLDETVWLEQALQVLPDQGIEDGPQASQPLFSNHGDPIAKDLSRLTNGHHLPESDVGGKAAVLTLPNTSTYLLSPVNTSTPNGQSRQPSLGLGGRPSEESAGLVDIATAKATSEQELAPEQLGAEMQRTPALTGSSRRSSSISADITQAEASSRYRSPIVTIERYSRGDSPSRSAAGAQRPRNRSSSLLSPHVNALESSEDEDLDATSESERAQSLSDQSPDVSRQSDPEGQRSSGNDRVGIDPDSREALNATEIPSLKDQEEQSRRMERNVEVEQWLKRSVTDSFGRLQIQSGTARARSHTTNAIGRGELPMPTSGPSEPFADALANPVIEEDFPSHHEGALESSTPVSPRGTPPPMQSAAEPEYIPPSSGEQFRPDKLYRPRPWVDPPWYSGPTQTKHQPPNANEAMMLFQKQSRDLEAASRVATWGTRRRSTTDIDFARGLSLSKILSGSKEKDDPATINKEKRPSIIEAGVKALRNTTDLKRKSSQRAAERGQRADSPEKLRKERSPSVSKRPKSPRLDTGSKIAAIGGTIAAIGARGSVSATGASPPPAPWTHVQERVRRFRSPSDFYRRPNSADHETSGLGDLLANYGGPPIIPLGSPQERDEPQGPLPEFQESDTRLEPSAEPTHPQAREVVAERTIPRPPVVATSSGFREHARQMFPRLSPFLIERVVEEQGKRYQTLVDFQVKHTIAVHAGTCASVNHVRGNLCFALGGAAHSLRPRGGSDADLSGYVAAAEDPSDDEDLGGAGGGVAAGAFARGVPAPPVKQLPAEFECPICFVVKRFRKPSDWTKHVHEDLQPFTCTFARCPDPKSFKRKADWVRHENELHRQLEWWTCRLPDCAHTCYRRHNFVQHLLREHKKMDTRSKTSREGSSGSRGLNHAGVQGSPSIADDEGGEDREPREWGQEELATFVERCHHETPHQPHEEPCRFCGEVCHQWRKLTVHVAQHLEELSLPLLDLLQSNSASGNPYGSAIDPEIPPQGSAMIADSLPLGLPPSGATSLYPGQMPSPSDMYTGYGPTGTATNTQAFYGVSQGGPNHSGAPTAYPVSLPHDEGQLNYGGGGAFGLPTSAYQTYPVAAPLGMFSNETAAARATRQYGYDDYGRLRPDGPASGTSEGYSNSRPMMDEVDEEDLYQ